MDQRLVAHVAAPGLYSEALVRLEFPILSLTDAVLFHTSAYALIHATRSW